VIGMIGLVSDIKHATRATFCAEGDAIVLFGSCTDEIGGSEYLARVHDVVAGSPPACDLSAERAAIEAMLECIEASHVSSAHDCSDGGLAVALAECCIANRDQPYGADVELELATGVSKRAAFFGETQARFVVSTSNVEAVLAIARSHGVPARQIGVVTDQSRGLRIAIAGSTLVSDVSSLSDTYHNAIPAIMSRAALASAPEQESSLVGV
jgi:phosphoribosylformylglycinamidine (FGAM) synthase-like enzyme